MGVVRLRDDLRQPIAEQVAAGRATSETEFLAEAIQRHAEVLRADDDRIIRAGKAGIADMEAGRFQVISGPGDIVRIQGELGRMLDGVEAQRGSAKP